MQFWILAERDQDKPLIEPLLDLTFGADRKARTTYRLRDDREPIEELCFVAAGEEGELMASIRFWSVVIEADSGGMTPAILLGPLAVDPRLQGKGVGRGLVAHSLGEARRLGYRICVVVGEPNYYAPFGFRSAVSQGLVMPGPVEPARFQVLELSPGALEGVTGRLRSADRSNHHGSQGNSAA